MFQWLFQNPIANMSAPWFLLMFVTVAACSLIAATIVIRLSDSTRDREDLPVPEKPDPYEIAFLRGGVPEVTRLAVFDLLQQGVIEMFDGKKLLGLFPTGKFLRRGSTSEETIRSNPLLVETANWFHMQRAPYDIYQSTDSLVKTLEPLCEPFEKRLKDHELLESDEHRAMRYFAGTVLSLGLISLTVYKLIAALTTGHDNVFFLIFLTIGSLTSTAVVCRQKRLSDLGRRYLERLQQAFESLKSAGSRVASTSPVEAHGMNPALLVAMGLFGVTVLQNSVYGDFYNLYRRAGSTGSGCGSGCGSSGCGGGCGGGGCGGCGGGG